MKFPKYWAKGKYELDPGHPFIAWHWSDASLAEAQQLADARAKELADRFQNGRQLDRYSYGIRPLREEVVQSIQNANGKEIGVVTRNGYGALVLNAASAMFIDIDFPEEGLGDALGKLFGRQPTSPESSHLQTIERWARGYPDLSMRVYRTFGGLRCLITNELFDPTQESSLALMRALKSDPLYVTLCKQQESFRARLTPKPWRCDTTRPPSGYPWDNASQEQVYRRWEQTYQRASARFTTCRLVKEIGKVRLHPDITPILNLHDESACSKKNLNLA
jgi:hypothetical protein